MPSSRRRPRLVPFPVRVALGSFVVFVVVLSGGALSAFSGTAPGTTTVQVPQRVCAAAVPGRWSCDAVRLLTRQVSAAEAGKLRAAGIARPLAPSVVAFGPAGGYSPAQLAAAYGVNAGT